ncbi:lipoprotein-like protein [Prochlorococcus marinus str. MIT 9312]|uniref:Lipoprotein-like protein n=1 Tax=Prochlorococcus marinus (strain MIT 9312) TaxID=74546 RepID=Q31AI2_PROM9|nr:hypothetical protein [Prochlorococcus marinus]ABB50113.1 lipoprotein-like protein [Prochlorococcus marinus str. MIT 9312]KGG01966.1 putative Borrelia lipoprotein [Prochlorococcus marinus str. MIT 9311]
MNIFLAILIFGIIFLFYKKFNSKKPKNLKLDKFKNKLQSTQTNIERIFLREEEKTFSNPNINIHIGIYDNEDIINRKSNIHRARLSKFRKSKLNGEIIFQDDEQRIYKFNNGKKVYL